jgi:hypothetical protein
MDFYNQLASHITIHKFNVLEFYFMYIYDV